MINYLHMSLPQRYSALIAAFLSSLIISFLILLKIAFHKQGVLLDDIFDILILGLLPAWILCLPLLRQPSKWVMVLALAGALIANILSGFLWNDWVYALVGIVRTPYFLVAAILGYFLHRSVTLDEWRKGFLIGLVTSVITHLSFLL